jgi:OOP family OmpA-OmpF porin
MHSKIFKPSALLLAAIAMPSVMANAQDAEPEWYVGLGGGVNISSLNYSNLDEELYPENKSNLSGVFSIFAEYDFGSQRQFAIRPQFSFLTRGGKISQIGQDYFDEYNYLKTDPDRLIDARYQLKATYLDFRVPLTYQFGNADWHIRPYVYVAPVVGFVNNGYVDARFEYGDGSYEGVSYDLTKANINSLYFAGAVGLGAKWQFNLSGAPFFLGVEVNYQLGVTDTYSSDEKNGDVANVSSFFETSGKVDGTRKINSLEVAATLGIPFSVFKSKTATPVVDYAPVAAEPAPTVEERPCYTLGEVLTMLNNGSNIEGKVICAIDDNINFEFGKSEINPSSYAYLNALADLFIRTKMRVRISGHTDAVGSYDTNMEISRKRALAVKQYLESRGVDGNKLSCTWYGYTRPIASNETDEGRKQNRRVEFEILK